MRDLAHPTDDPPSGRLKRLIVAGCLAGCGLVVAMRLLSRYGRSVRSQHDPRVAAQTPAPAMDASPLPVSPPVSPPHRFRVGPARLDEAEPGASTSELVSGAPSVAPKSTNPSPASESSDDAHGRIGYLTVVALAAILCVAAVLRLVLLVRGQWMIDYDEALTGLVSKHILEGERPIFMVSVPYMGLLEGYLVAGVFAIMGLSREALKVVPFLFSLAFVGLTFFLAREIFSNTRIALLSALFAALPPVYATVHELKAWGSTVETMVFGSLLLLIAARLLYKENTSRQRVLLYVALGVVTGVAFWVHFLVAYYLFTIGVIFFWRDRRFFLRRPFWAAVPAFFLGSLPFWAYNVVYPLATFTYLMRPGERTAHTPRVSYIGVLEHLFTSDLPHVLGVPWNWADRMDAEWFARGMAVVASLSFAALAIWRIREVAGRKNGKGGGWSGKPVDLLLIFVPVMVVIYLLSGYGKAAVNTTGVDTSGRYLVTFFAVLPILLSAALYSLRRAHWVLVAVGVVLVLGANLYSSYVADPIKMFQSPYYNRLPPSNDTLVAYLRSNGLRYVWTDVAVGLPLMFDSREDVLAADYVTLINRGNDYFPAFRQAIIQAPTTAYVVVGLPGAKTKLEGELEKLKVTFTREELSPYVVIVPRSRNVDPSEVVDGLGFQY